MSFIKNTLKNTVSLVLAAGIIGTAYAAITTVNSGDPLTASSWNEMVTRLTSNDTNSTDLVTKSYVDSSVSASGGGGWSNCESKYTGVVGSPSTLSCSVGKSIRSHTATCTGGDNTGCGVESLTNTTLVGYAYTHPSNGSYRSKYSGSIICCDD